ncbi:hypothetical protein Sfulv_15870 [Streptomyces fulvorobeus]|uniref:Uncharacterized protein n=1 Tax=Streptomyces fulvorobeus TaxID=284028 RepID=A0A7J0C4Y9_9ACTN|nr:hypothetical protein Sfulv_15870 [Streptomyces fulvorobeus]
MGRTSVCGTETGPGPSPSAARPGGPVVPTRSASVFRAPEANGLITHRDGPAALAVPDTRAAPAVPAGGGLRHDGALSIT